MTDYFLQSLSFAPLTRDTWPLFENLFGPRGACANCWCMFYRLPKKDFEAGKKLEGNKQAMKQLVWDGKPTGLMAIHEGKAIAWCAFAPREDYLKLEKSRVHAKIDAEKVWSIPCTFILKEYREKGVSVALLQGLIEYARQSGIAILEAYPVIPSEKKLPDAFAWTGLYKSFARAGFKVVDQRSKNRPMVRFCTVE